VCPVAETLLGYQTTSRLGAVELARPFSDEKIIEKPTGCTMAKDYGKH
jgi:hypothetical protein